MQARSCQGRLWCQGQRCRPETGVDEETGRLRPRRGSRPAGRLCVSPRGRLRLEELSWLRVLWGLCGSVSGRERRGQGFACLLSLSPSPASSHSAQTAVVPGKVCTCARAVRPFLGPGSQACHCFCPSLLCAWHRPAGPCPPRRPLCALGPAVGPARQSAEGEALVVPGSRFGLKLPHGQWSFGP